MMDEADELRDVPRRDPGGFVPPPPPSSIILYLRNVIQQLCCRLYTAK